MQGNTRYWELYFIFAGYLLVGGCREGRHSILENVYEIICKSSVNHLVADDLPPVIYGDNSATLGGRCGTIRGRAQDGGGSICS